MMKDHTFDDLIDEVRRDFPVLLPKKVIRVIIKTTLHRMFKILAQGDTAITIRNSKITKFYNRIDFEELKLKFMDLDETKESLKFVDSFYLRKLHAQGSPRIKHRSKPNVTFVYHRGVN